MVALDNNLIAGLFVFTGFVLLFLLMAMLVRWARGRSKGAMAVGALLSVVAPDPTLERNIKLAEEAKEIRSEKDRGGEP